jgi:hypothetical protein
MSNYRDFVQDFPRRCRDVLKSFAAESEKQDRDVTLLLMAATAGFVMPYERLGEGDAIKQPTLDRPKFVEAMERLKGELAKTLDESVLFKDANWRGGRLRSAVGTPDDWPECQMPQALAPDTPVSEAVRYLRHSLAHGNVFSRGARPNQIDELVFVCGGTLKKNHKEIPLKFLVLSPKQLRQFLDRWFELVESLHVPHRSILEVVDQAA